MSASLLLRATQLQQQNTEKTGIAGVRQPENRTIKGCYDANMNLDQFDYLRH